MKLSHFCIIPGLALFSSLYAKTEKLPEPDSTYVRFHIESLPKSGKVTLSASFQLHHTPWGARANFGERGISSKLHVF
ncbi:MAG: hypothetical protein VW643_06675, partial [Opitutales bacterium]